MEQPSPCPYRYVYKGRTFCAIAIRDRRYTTSEVVPGACASCKARPMLEEVGCAHLNLGVEVDQYGGSHEVNIFYASCERFVERLVSSEHCGKDRCPHWEPANESAIEKLREKAMEDLRRREATHDD